MASYRVEVAEEARREIRRLPGNVRQRVIRVLKALQDEQRPGGSRSLETTIDLQPNMELRRIRLDAWRVVYLLEEEVNLVTVLAIRKRPPYQYDDLEELLRQV